MKLFLLSLFLLPFAIFTPLILSAEVVQLIEESSLDRADWFKQYSEKDLVEIQEIKKLLITFVKSSKKTQLKLLSSKYKGIYKNTEEVLSSAFDKQSYSKIDFRKIEYFDQDSATIKANLYWGFEGYEGLQTFYFKLVKEKENWLVDWMVY